MSLNLFKKPSFAGVDIGHKTTQIVQVDRTGGAFKITRAAAFPTPEDAVKDGVVIEPDIIGIAIKAAVKEHKINASAAVVGVSGGTVIVRTVRVPAMNDVMLRKSIKYEAGRYVPSSIEDSFIEFEILSHAPDEQMDVLIVAAPREVVQSKVKAVEKAGLEVDIVDVEAFAMYRSLVESDDTSILQTITIALVDIGATTTTVSVVNKGTFAMTRTIPQAGQTWTDALKAYFKLSDEQAEAGKAQLDLKPLIDAAVLENQPLRVLQPHVDDLIREIRRSLNYFQSQQTEGASQNPVTHLVVSGGGAKLPGLGEYLSHKLGVQVLCTGVLDNPRFLLAAQNDIGNGMDFSVATGLAMRAFSKAA